MGDMPLLRLLLAGLVALAAMVAVLFTALVVLFTGLAGFVVQLFRPTRVSGAPPPSPRTAPSRDDGVIDVEVTRVPDEQAKHRP